MRRHPVFSERPVLNEFIHLPIMNDLTKRTDIAKGTAFITGATGFIGGFLLKELLLNNCFQHYICLVRATDQRNAFERIRNNLINKGTPEHLIESSSISAEVGDIMKEDFGLSKMVFEKLTNDVHHVFHFAATMNWVNPFNTSTVKNIEALHTILRLCSSHHGKKLHYASSMGLWALLNHKSETILESDLHARGEELPGGYFQSKWISEHVLKLAEEAGIPINVYRIGDVKGDSQNGLGDPHNLGNLFMQYFIQKGLAVDSSIPQLNFIPVDYLTKAIVAIIKNDGAGTFQFSNTELISFKDIYNEAKSAGHTIELIGMDQWLEVLEVDPLETAKLLRPIFRTFRPYSGAAPTSYYKIGMDMFRKNHDTTNTDRALAGEDIKCPRMVEDGVLQKYLNHLGELIVH